MKTHFFTSESVTEGHPDKIADQISDAVLDSIFEQDPKGRVACETFVTTGMVIVAGEVSTSCYIDVPKIVRNTVRDIGYIDRDLGFEYSSCGVLTAIQEQSPDIALGVDTGGAGDQGMMFGYAVNETSTLMPLPITLAHALTMQLAKVRKLKVLNYLWPDGKSQVTIKYDGTKPVDVDTVVISAHHKPGVSMERIRDNVVDTVVKEVLTSYGFWNDKIKIFVNPTGRFEVGGPQCDTGLTGRKIIIDTYGGMGAHGGGCFSGKDPTKVDRSASYMGRYIAKNIVASGAADRCQLQLAYAIGVKDPISISVDTFGTCKVDESKIENVVKDMFDLTPYGIINTLKLRRPIYTKTASYGHFGREDKGFAWEATDRASAIKSALNL